MSGRAGRRGKDERGICIIMIDEQVILDIIVISVCDIPVFIHVNVLYYYLGEASLSASCVHIQTDVEDMCYQ